MKRLFTYLLALMIIATFSSCNNKGGTSNDKEEKKDTLYNDNIQDTFFDVPFGSSKKELIAKFKEHGFMVVEDISTDDFVHFASKKSSLFSFGNMSWEMLSVGFTNDKFDYIRIMNYGDDKASAIENYETVLSTLSAKYHMTEEEPEDTTVYRLSIGYSKQNRTVAVSCYRYETLGKNICIGVGLIYYDERFSNKVSDEL